MNMFTKEAGATLTTIEFGSNANQVSHVIRHLEEAGFNNVEIQTVKNLIRNDLSKVAEQIKIGKKAIPRTLNFGGRVI